MIRNDKRCIDRFMKILRSVSSLVRENNTPRGKVTIVSYHQTLPACVECKKAQNSATPEKRHNTKRLFEK